MHAVAACAVDSAGRALFAIGDVDVPIFPRSTAKPFIAGAIVASGAAERFAFDARELAVICASHNGEPFHVAAVESILAKAGLDTSALQCGAQVPAYEPAAARLAADGIAPGPIHNNCSGKHAAMLATCAVMGWPLDGYLELEHPCQQAVSAALQEMLGVDLAAAPRGIDGCGLTTYGAPLASVARGFASGSHDPAFRRAQDAMAAHPFLVAGTGRFDTALLEVAGTRLTAKIGGAGVWAAVARPGGPGIAIKLESGGGDVIPVVALAVLQQLGLLVPDLPDRLRPYARLTVRNWAGRDVGEIRADPIVLS